MADTDPFISVTSMHLFAALCEELLSRGMSARFHAPGRSMYPTIKENEVITVAPIEPSSISVGDIILYRQDKRVVAHRVVRMIQTETGTFPPWMLESCHPSLLPPPSFVTRDDTWSKENVQVAREKILGKIISVERGGREIDPYCRKARLRLLIHNVGSGLRRVF
jgi:hypothetical protein